MGRLKQAEQGVDALKAGEKTKDTLKNGAKTEENITEESKDIAKNSDGIKTNENQSGKINKKADEATDVAKQAADIDKSAVDNVAEAGNATRKFVKETADESLDLDKVVEEAVDKASEGGLDIIVNNKGVPYPEVKDVRTGKNMAFPNGVDSRIPKEDRVGWYRNQKEANLYRTNNTDILCKRDYIDEWYKRGYETPEGGWGLYEIHHIKPREFGGNANFENMMPILIGTHRKSVTPWWNNYGSR